MKKNIFLAAALLAVALSVSACTNNNEIPDDVNDNIKINNSANAIVTPDTSAIASSAPVTPVVKNTPMKTLEGQEDLFAKYSQAVIKTNMGNITVKFYGDESPITVNNFLNLAQKDFYNGTKFHRVIKDFMIQGGDPESKKSDTSAWGTGGPSYRFDDEFNTHKLVTGSLAMANSGSNTNGSQFFIVTADATPWLDGKHTNFGEVVSGLDIVKKIDAVETVNPAARDDRPVKDVIINSVELLK